VLWADTFGGLISLSCVRAVIAITICTPYESARSKSSKKKSSKKSSKAHDEENPAPTSSSTGGADADTSTGVAEGGEGSKVSQLLQSLKGDTLCSVRWYRLIAHVYFVHMHRAHLSAICVMVDAAVYMITTILPFVRNTCVYCVLTMSLLQPGVQCCLPTGPIFQWGGLFIIGEYMRMA